MNHIEYTAKRLKEFEKLTPKAFKDGRNFATEEKWLETENHLYLKHLYDEPAFTLSKVKVMEFITITIQQAVTNERERIAKKK